MMIFWIKVLPLGEVHLLSASALKYNRFHWFVDTFVVSKLLLRDDTQRLINIQFLSWGTTSIINLLTAMGNCTNGERNPLWTREITSNAGIHTAKKRYKQKFDHVVVLFLNDTFIKKQKSAPIWLNSWKRRRGGKGMSQMVLLDVWWTNDGARTICS